MWPKALAQIIELAPHVTRLLPLADRFFQSKSAEAEASRTAMEQMAEGLRGDLGQVTASHAGLYRQLNDQSEKLSTVTADLRATRASVEAVEARLITIEAKLTSLQRSLVVVLLVLSSISLLIVILILKHL